MKQKDRWKIRCHEYTKFIKDNNRCPSRHHEEERSLHSWYKNARKMMNAGKLSPERLDRFKQIIALAEAHRHVNQYR